MNADDRVTNRPPVHFPVRRRCDRLRGDDHDVFDRARGRRRGSRAAAEEREEKASTEHRLILRTCLLGPSLPEEAWWRSRYGAELR
jgi:hypothetical protein